MTKGTPVQFSLTETRRRVYALCAFRCPDHGDDLTEEEEVEADDGGRVFVVVSYSCPHGCHFSSHLDVVGGYSPVDHDEALERYADPGPLR